MKPISIILITVASCTVIYHDIGPAHVFDFVRYHAWNLEPFAVHYNEMLHSHMNLLHTFHCAMAEYLNQDLKGNWMLRTMFQYNDSLWFEITDTLALLDDIILSMNHAGLGMDPPYFPKNDCSSYPVHCESTEAVYNHISTLTKHPHGFLHLDMICNNKAYHRRDKRQVLTNTPWEDKGEPGILKSWFGLAYSDDVSYAVQLARGALTQNYALKRKMAGVVNVTARMVKILKTQERSTTLAIRHADAGMKAVRQLRKVLSDNKADVNTLYVNAMASRWYEWCILQMGRIVGYWTRAEHTWTTGIFVLRSGMIPSQIMNAQEYLRARKQMDLTTPGCNTIDLYTETFPLKPYSLDIDYVGGLVKGFVVGFPVACHVMKGHVYRLENIPIVTPTDMITPKPLPEYIVTTFPPVSVKLDGLIGHNQPFLIPRYETNHTSLDCCFSPPGPACSIHVTERKSKDVEYPHRAIAHNGITMRVPSCDHLHETRHFPSGVTYINTAFDCKSNLTPTFIFRKSKNPFTFVPRLSEYLENSTEDSIVPYKEDQSFSELLSALENVSAIGLDPVSLPKGMTFEEYIEGQSIFKGVKSAILIIFGGIAGFGGFACVCMVFLHLVKGCYALDHEVQILDTCLNLTQVLLLTIVILYIIKIWGVLKRTARNKPVNLLDNGQGLPLALNLTCAHVGLHGISHVFTFTHAHIPGPPSGWAFRTSKAIKVNVTKIKGVVHGVVDWEPDSFLFNETIIYLVQSNFKLPRDAKFGWNIPKVGSAIHVLRIEVETLGLTMCLYEACNLNAYTPDSVAIPIEE